MTEKVSWDRIKQEANRERERLSSSQVSVPIKETKERFERVDRFLEKRLEIIRTVAEQIEHDPELDQLEETDWEISLSSQINIIREARESAHSSDIPIDIYYYLYDLQNDFNTEGSTYIVGAGMEVNVKKLHDKLPKESRVRRKPDNESATQSDLSTISYDPPPEAPDKLRVIRLPRNELQNPLSYALIVHELLHHTDILDTVKTKLEEHTDSVPEDVRTEVCIDTVCMVYLGPAYVPALVRLHDKVKSDRDSTHPDFDERSNYLYKHLNILDEEVGERPIYGEMIKEAKEEIRYKRSDEEYVPDYGEFVEKVRDELKKTEIPLFIQKYDDLFCLHGLNTDSQVGIHHGDANSESGKSGTVQRRDKQRSNLRTLLGVNGSAESDAGESKAVAVAIKPLLLFNLLLLLDDQRSNDVETMVMSSFRKWYARTLVSQF